MTTGTSSRTLESFNQNIADAYALLDYACDREGTGSAALADPSPLLRQAVVAASAALETYVGDKVMDCIGPAIKDMNSSKLAGLDIKLGDAYKIIQAAKDGKESAGLGIRKLIRPEVERRTSCAPRAICDVMSYVGQKDVMPSIDKLRDVAQGTTTQELQHLASHRNRIAHSGDRAETGHKRNPISTTDVSSYLAMIDEVVVAFEALLRDRAGMAKTGAYPNWNLQTFLQEVKKTDRPALPLVERLFNCHTETVDHWYWAEGEIARVHAVFNDASGGTSQPYSLVAASPARLEINLKWMTRVPAQNREVLLDHLRGAGLCPPETSLETKTIRIGIGEQLADATTQNELLRAIETAVQPSVAEAEMVSQLQSSSSDYVGSSLTTLQ